MNTIPLITQLVALVASGSMIWLVIRAFKTTPGWGFAVLLLSPVSAIAFGVKYWEKQKAPFLLYISTLTAALVLCIYLFTVSGGTGLLSFAANFKQDFQSQDMNIKGNGQSMRVSLSVEDKSAGNGMFRQDPDFISGQMTGENTKQANADTRAEEIATTVDKPAKEKKKQVRYRLTYKPINVGEIKKHIGATAKITRKNAVEKEYLITGASPKHIEVAQRSKNGKFSFHFKNSDIAKVRILVNEPY